MTVASADQSRTALCEAEAQEAITAARPSLHDILRPAEQVVLSRDEYVDVVDPRWD
jgi:hypothetical protein